MKTSTKNFLLCSFFIAFLSCDDENNNPTKPNPEINTNVNFQYKTTIKIGGEGASEISAYDTTSKKLYTVNVEANEISSYNLSNLDSPVKENPISITSGSPNSVAAYNGKIAIAIEAENKQNNGKVTVYNTANNSLVKEFTVGALPDMVTFSKDGKYILCANEGEPNDDYTVDPNGSVSIIDLATEQVTTLDFTAFNDQEITLEANGFRVFGPNANLAADVEPEYIAVSDDSKTAWVALQENNGIAKINLETKVIEAIYPLGFKDYNVAGHEIDPSNKDDKTELRKVPVYGMYQPDGITTVNINGIDYIFSANEGDSREYEGTPGFVNEDRIKDITLDSIAFPKSNDYQNDANLGRLKIALDLGDTDKDGDYDKLYSYGARSFSVWSSTGSLLYDSGNSIATETLNATPNRFNDKDKRSDDKGAEPEAVEILNIANNRYILFVGLERTDQIMVYDVTNPTSPVFLTILSHEGDEAPEGLLVIPAKDSPTRKDLLVVSNEDSGTVTIYENKQ